MLRSLRKCFPDYCHAMRLTYRYQNVTTSIMLGAKVAINDVDKPGICGTGLWRREAGRAPAFCIGIWTCPDDIACGWHHECLHSYQMVNKPPSFTASLRCDVRIFADPLGAPCHSAIDCSRWAGTKGGLTCLTGGHLFKIDTVCMERNDG